MELEADVELRQAVFKVQQFKTCSSEGAIMKGQSKKPHGTVVWVDRYVYELKQWSELAILLYSSY